MSCLYIISDLWTNKVNTFVYFDVAKETEWKNILLSYESKNSETNKEYIKINR